MEVGIVTTLVLGALPGCDSTQQKNARAQLVAQRELASRKLPDVRPGSPVAVTRTSLIRGRRSTAFVVDLRSRAAKPLTDVPIVVGVRTPGGRREPLNARKGLDWFQTHVPAIAAGGRATWVFERKRSVTAGARPYARVGIPASPALSDADSLPTVEATARTEPVSLERRRRRRSSARVEVANVSDVPQYELQVYALVRAHGRYVAAGKRAIEHLGTGERTTVTVPLTGRARRQGLRAHAIPTIFR
jgi:hypothetical protein